MVFSSLTFLYAFFPCLILFYNLVKKIKAKNLVLLFFSLLFYSWGEPRFIILLMFSTFINYLLGIFIYNHKNLSAKIALIIAIVFNLGILIFYKYSNFLLSILNNIFDLNITYFNVVLPIGISFYTFQILTYVIDIYWGKAKVQYSYTDLLLYVSMFPQLIAGPIVRYFDVQNQIKKRRVTAESFSAGITRFLIGLSKKVIIANHAGDIASNILDFSVIPPGTISVWYGVIMFTFQIYFDFSGYSDMAIGLGKMLGFDFMENFNYPYTSTSITEFWRRWHISLSTFFRDYVYIPLGGNKKNQIRNIMIVWILTGIWHGASYNFIIWGLFYGMFLIIEKKLIGKFISFFPKIFGLIYTMFFVIIGWAIFYFVNLKELLIALKVMFIPTFFVEDVFVIQSIEKNIFFIMVAYFASTKIPITFIKILGRIFYNKKNKLYFIGSFFKMVFNASSLFLCTALLTGQTYNPFLYFRF